MTIKSAALINKKRKAIHIRIKKDLKELRLLGEKDLSRSLDKCIFCGGDYRSEINGKIPRGSEEI